MDFLWYQQCPQGDDSLSQGDFIPSCPLVIPPADLGVDMEVEVQEIDSIIMTQSCDLEHGKAEIVLMCPYYSIEDWLSDLPAEQQSKKGRKKAVDQLRKGFMPGYHLLNMGEADEPLNFYPVVDFRNVYGIQYQLLKDLVADMNNRVRLLPPYREHLSQAFARYFMRVGLPQDIVVEGY